MSNSGLSSIGAGRPADSRSKTPPLGGVCFSVSPSPTCPTPFSPSSTNSPSLSIPRPLRLGRGILRQFLISTRRPATQPGTSHVPHRIGTGPPICPNKSRSIQLPHTSTPTRQYVPRTTRRPVQPVQLSFTRPPLFSFTSLLQVAFLRSPHPPQISDLPLLPYLL